MKCVHRHEANDKHLVKFEIGASARAIQTCLDKVPQGHTLQLVEMCKEAQQILLEFARE